MDRDELGERMKGYEAAMTGAYLDPKCPYIVRLDGRAFHTFVKGMQRPFDQRIHRAMTNCTKDMVAQFPECVFGYTQSDEITLVFPSAHDEYIQKKRAAASARKKQPKQQKKRNREEMEAVAAAASSSASESNGKEEEEKKSVAEEEVAVDDLDIGQPSEDDYKSLLVFGGRVQKVVSTMAAYCSVRFNIHLMRDEWPEAALKERVSDASAHFDARVFSLPSQDEVLHNILWRHIADCRKNSKTLLGYSHFPHKALQNVAADKVVQMLMTQKGVDWHAMPSPYKFGVFVKRELYEIQGLNPKTGEATVATRSRIAGRSFDMPHFNAANVKLIFARTWNDADAAVKHPFEPA